MKPYMTNLVMTDEAAQRPIGARAAGPTRATTLLAAIDHSPTGPVQLTGQEPRRGEGE